LTKDTMGGDGGQPYNNRNTKGRGLTVPNLTMGRLRIR